MHQTFLRLANLGDIGTHPAEAFEPPGGIDDRVARHRDPARAARSPKLHLQRIERLLFEKHAAELGMASEESGTGMAEQLARRLAEHHAHARADVGDSVVGIDGPQPADAPLLIFLEQQAGALALAADVGIHLELVEGPAGYGHDASDRYA